jgi:Ca-activated chloride channel family protein
MDILSWGSQHMRKRLSFLIVGPVLVCAATPYGAGAQAPSPPAGQPAPQASAAASQTDDLRLNRDVVTLSVTVSDPYGRFVTGLDKTHFEVYDDKIKQDISFFNDDDAPITLGIVYDVSGSMESKVSRSLHALRRFVETSHNDDEYFLVGFNQRAQLLRDFTTSGESVVNSLTLVSTDGRTALYDAAYIGVEKARQGRHQKKALLIISDGQDNNSRYTFSELRDLVREADVQLYAIGIVDLIHDSELGAYGESVLEELSRSTGGRAFFPSSEEELVDVCTQIALELRHQYSIGYYPSTDVRDGRWHKLKVKVDPPPGLPRLAVRAKEGYFGLKR